MPDRVHNRHYRKGIAMLAFFRTISVIEGLSYLVILGVTVGLVGRDYVFYLGMTHGVLFLVYLVSSLLASNSRGWSVLVWLALFLAALVPFAFVPVELFLRREARSPMTGSVPG